MFTLLKMFRYYFLTIRERDHKRSNEDSFHQIHERDRDDG